jgi:hypothetical protein
MVCAVRTSSGSKGAVREDQRHDTGAGLEELPRLDEQHFRRNLLLEGMLDPACAVAAPNVAEVTCRLSSDQSPLENGAGLRGLPFSVHREGESATVWSILSANSRGLRPLRDR